MRETNAKTCFHILLAIILAAGVVALATNNSFAVAQQPCQVQLGQPNVSVQQYYYGSNLQLTLPVSATCPYYADQLYAAGSAYDTTYGTSLGTAQTGLSSTYGYGNTGQLTFTVPSSAQGHSVQFWVSIYGGENGYYGGYYGNSLLAQTSATYVVSPTYYQGYPTYPSYPSYPSYPNYPTYPPYPSYPSYPQYPQYPQYAYYPGYYYGSPHYWFYYHSGYRYHYYCRSWHWSNNNYCYTPPP